MRLLWIFVECALCFATPGHEVSARLSCCYVDYLDEVRRTTLTGSVAVAAE